MARWPGMTITDAQRQRVHNPSALSGMTVCPKTYCLSRLLGSFRSFENFPQERTGGQSIWVSTPSILEYCITPLLRSVMMTQHLPQHLVVSGSEPPYVQTGIEYRLGEFTFSARMPHDGVICRIIPRYARGVGSDDIKGVPEQTIIYQKESNGEYDVINVKGWECFHQYFGFKTN